MRHRVAGRLAARRGQGKMAFLDLVDRSGPIQLQARVDVLGDESMRAPARPRPRRPHRRRRHRLQSRRGELTLRVDDCTLLAKSLRPPPDKHHGLQDVETRYRHRELDLIANEETRELFVTRARGSSPRSAATSTTTASSRSRRRSCSRSTAARWRARSRRTTTRSTATSTCASPPSSTSSADRRRPRARLRARQGLPQRGALAKHNPEFTMLEWYEAYADYEDVAARLEQLVGAAAAGRRLRGRARLLRRPGGA